MSANDNLASYICANCGIGSVKLWRDGTSDGGYINTGISCKEPEKICRGRPKLLCATCARAQFPEARIPPLSEWDHGRGSYVTRNKLGWELDHIESFVPAVPTKEPGAFWLWMYVPGDAKTWWRSLPLQQTFYAACALL